ncbi:Protein ABHD16A [Schistosoma japonicum]|uniref:Protein ABHD16A n=1 Tax=Schistosoma japonicum TaxID=6182 RepID=A0A4Z2CU16_SCHJA|nr:Protein ABHD16A [Schistosoma japonicum]TNN07588.1 Protein ABHD16A [Schistosoma japonicum]TNN07589.1 Protein ABHD16A [Schistosoma japonicum]TNN07590.1 Protein ABHD16A [Schistosoma japonicum]
MWRTIHVWWSCVFGPSLYSVPTITTYQSTDYNPNSLELVSNSAIKVFHLMVGVIKWTALFWSPWAFRNLKFRDNFSEFSRFVAVTFTIYFCALLLRGTGRFFNHTYQEFMALFLESKKKTNEDTVSKLTLYTFSSPWPVHFDVRNLPVYCLKPKKTSPKRNSQVPTIFVPIIWIIAHTVGIRLTYVGCTWIFNCLTFKARLDARSRLQLEYNIQRVGLSTRDGEFVEAFYADRRNKSNSESVSVDQEDFNGEILVLCCEGNGGYPEIGTPWVPLGRGYSVLGWNHPGFGESTGLPFPEKEQNAVEACFLFAVHQLNFQPSQIYVLGWSIGGYTASWIAMNYPDIAGLILDATFDNIDELSKRIAPPIFTPVLDFTVKEYLDLNNLSHVINYDGPVLIIRRSDDEVITTGENHSRATNRGNNLLIGLLKHRFPYLMTTENEFTLNTYLSLNSEEQKDALSKLTHNPNKYEKLVVNFLKSEALKKQINSNSNSTTCLYPSELGKEISKSDVKTHILFYLVSQYFIESPGSHCVPLEGRYLRPPWSPLTQSLSESSSSDLDAKIDD